MALQILQYLQRRKRNRPCLRSFAALPIVKGKDESLFCGGDCQQWLHRYCAGVSAQVYRSMTEKGATFSCYACSLVTHRKEIDDLKDAVELLRGEIAELKSATSGSRLGTSSSNPFSSRISAMVGEASVSPPCSALNTRANDNRNQEKKFNVVLYGVDESPSGASKSTRLEDDLKKAVSVISGVNQSINSHSIKDIFRLGRFSAEKGKPRPLLVKFIRATDATSVLSRRGSPQGSPVVIKPDMSPTERKCESMLLRERWSLIQPRSCSH